MTKDVGRSLSTPIWWTRIMVEAAWYCACDAAEALHKGFRRGWALGSARRVR